MTLQSWRYMVQVLTDMEMQRELDDLGNAGWELVTAHWEEFHALQQELDRTGLPRSREAG